MRIPREPLEAIFVRRQLTAADWRTAVDEKLRCGEYHRAGYEPLPGVTLTLARQIEEDKP
jgi:hypothetical protein